MGTKITWTGMEYDILLDARSGSASIGAFVGLDAPGAGPPRHIHHDADESFYILSGEVEFWVAGKTIFAQAGEMLTVPRGTEHCFRIIGDAPARMLTIMTPGGFESFFVDVARARASQPDRLGDDGSVQGVLSPCPDSGGKTSGQNPLCPCIRRADHHRAGYRSGAEPKRRNPRQSRVCPDHAFHGDVSVYRGPRWPEPPDLSATPPPTGKS